MRECVVLVIRYVFGYDGLLQNVWLSGWALAGWVATSHIGTLTHLVDGSPTNQPTNLVYRVVRP